MPIVVQSVSLDKYLLWLFSQLSDSDSDFSLNSPLIYFISLALFPSLISFKNTNLNSFSIIPIKIYSNADFKKFKILKNNKKKLGIYRWINNINGKFYIDSAIDLSNRIQCYYNSHLKKSNMVIYEALRKYGHTNL